MISSEDVRKIEEKGGKTGLNFIAEMCPDIQEQIRFQASRKKREELPLFCEPLFVKDNIDVAGMHTTAGSLALSDHIAAEDAEIVRNLRKNGAVILGKSNMTEFANFMTPGMPAGYSSRGGQVFHATDRNLSPSGSSSGSAVAVSSGAVRASIGTDTSFSVLACAQENGICGLKPAHGNLSSEGILPLARTLDSAGVLARDFETALRVYNGMREKPADFSPADLKSVRIAVDTANEDMVSEGQLKTVAGFLSKMEARGAAIGKVCHPPAGFLRTIMRCEFREQLEAYLSGTDAARKTLREIVDFCEAEPEKRMKYGDGYLRAALYETPLGTKEKSYAEAMRKREEMIATLKAELRSFDAILMTGPTNVMHLCGFPSAALALPELAPNGCRRCLIFYGTDEKRLYNAVLAFEHVYN